MIKKQISVRHLVEFIMTKGSIDSRIRSLENSATIGVKLHKKIQKAGGENYQKEIPLKLKVKINGQGLIISGRADGIIREGEEVTIDEIKTSAAEFTDVAQEQLDLYWAQGICYGYFLARAEDLATVTIQLTYIQSTTETVTQSQRHYSYQELEGFFEALLDQYKPWFIFQQNWANIRDASINELAFPYGEYRAGQRELAVASYKTILAQKKLYVEAPTGTGKTISTLFPGIKSIGQGETEKVFYLTAKTITRQVAEDAVTGMTKKGLELKSVTLTAKDKICFLSERICTPEHCPFANGYYNRLNEGLFDLLQHENQMTREVIERYAKKHTLCPFELSLDVSLWCELIIADYNYVFDPIVYLRRFFNSDKEDYLFLVDEAHNLVSRGKEMFSASLEQKELIEVEEKLTETDEVLKQSVTELNKMFASLQESLADKPFIKQIEPVEAVFTPLYRFTEAVKEWLPKNTDTFKEDGVLTFYFKVLNYLKISELYDERYLTYVSGEKNELMIKQLCLDPSYLLAQKLARGKASVLFSASFSPLYYYRDVLGGVEEGLTYRLSSPFNPKQQLLLIDQSIPTTYKERDKSISAIVEDLHALVTGKQGNYMVFFPSYVYLEKVLASFKLRYPDIQTLVQEKTMSEEEREAFLTEYQSNPSQSLLGFCILGGIFAEGIDLKGDRLSGVAVVGVGLPQISIEQEFLKKYYNQSNGRGFQYAYQIPGMNKVLQSAGRVIRDSHDVGVVLLIDQRFNTQGYRQYFPLHWQHAKVINQPSQLNDELEKFWERKSSETSGVT